MRWEKRRGAQVEIRRWGYLKAPTSFQFRAVRPSPIPGLKSLETVGPNGLQERFQAGLLWQYRFGVSDSMALNITQSQGLWL